MDKKDAAAFWAKVDKSGECWEWLGPRRSNGTPLLWWGRTVNTAYRVSYELWYGVDLGRKQIKRTCETVPCVRPDHYRASIRIRDLQKVNRLRISTIEDRLWSKVIKSGDCWVKKDTKRPSSYWFIIYNGKHAYAHRVAYEITFGKIPEGLLILHKCDNPPCINPAHLRLGTYADNAQDMVRKGRGGGIKLRGRKIPLSQVKRGSSKLTWEEVREIRRLYEKEKMSIKILAQRYNVSFTCVWNITTKRTWQEGI